MEEEYTGCDIDVVGKLLMEVQMLMGGAMTWTKYLVLLHRMVVDYLLMGVLLCLLGMMIEVGEKYLLLNMCFVVLDYFEWK